VDLSQSGVSGFLRIKNLVDRDLTTFFTGEIIGAQHSFITNAYDADAGVDSAHWSRFPPFRPLSKLVFGKDPYMYDYVNR
jgi:hypothetical protein